MFLLIAVLAVLSAATLLYFRDRRQRRALTNVKSNYLPEETHLRPLFAPTKSELERETREQAAAKQVAAVASEQNQLKAALDRARSDWDASPRARTAGALLKVATESKSADTFAETAFEILRAFRKGRMSGAAENDLADLLDSHYKLLPVNERSSGAIFLVKEEIAKLRTAAKQNAG